jgi:hypothetical protein
MMNVRNAIVVDTKHQAYKDELEAVFDEAIKVEAVAAEADSEGQRPAASKRFKAIGERILLLTDEREHTGDAVRHEEHAGMIELGVGGLAIALKARQGRVNASFMPWQLSDVEASWVKDGDVDAPLATQAVSSADVNFGNVTPQTYGMLNLIEQSLDTAELAQGGMLPLRQSAEATA